MSLSNKHLVFDLTPAFTGAPSIPHAHLLGTEMPFAGFAAAVAERGAVDGAALSRYRD